MILVKESLKAVVHSLYNSMLYNDSGLKVLNCLHDIGVVCFMLGTIFEVIIH